MNIWVIGRSYPQRINNMQGSFEIEQAKMLQKHKNNVAYLSCVFHPFKKVRKWGFCYWNENGLDIFSYSQFYVHERMKLHLEQFQIKIWSKFLCMVESKKGLPDIIHIHYPANITIAKVILEYQKRGIKIICTEHWSQVLRKTIDFYEIERLRLYVNNANAFLCVGHSLRQSIIELTNTKREIFVIPNIVNSVFFPSSQKKEGFNFIAVGALVPHKRFDRIIMAFSAEFKGITDIKLVVVGGGTEERNLKKLVHRLEIEDQVTFTGLLQRENTAREISQCNALVCYSNLETFGVPIIEAWACGIPVITTTAVAVREGWDDRLGIQVSLDDDRELANKMKIMYDSINKYDSKFLSEYAKINYSEETIYQKLMDFYYGH